MSEKLTVRKVIGKCRVSENCFSRKAIVLPDGHCSGPFYAAINEKLNGAKEFDLVANVPVERRLVRGDAKWSQSKSEPNRWNLFTSECEIAYIHKIHAGEFYWQVHNKCARAETLEAAQQAVEYALADQEKGGFRWEPDLPEYVRYQVGYKKGIGKFMVGTSFDKYETAHEYYAASVAICLYGFRADGSVDILARKGGE